MTDSKSSIHPFPPQQSSSSASSSDIRQRRPLAPQPSHTQHSPPALTPSQQQHQFTPFVWTRHLTRWHQARLTTSLPTRTLMHLAELFSLALSIRVLACTHHLLVTSIDQTWETLSRRAQSPFLLPGTWSVGVGIGVLAVWHVVLWGISFGAAGGLFGDGGGNEDRGVGKRGSWEWGWGRALGSVIVPIYLFFSLWIWSYGVLDRPRVPIVVDVTKWMESEGVE